MKQAGFTLVELMVTLVLLSVISLVALPALGEMVDAQRRQDAAQRLASGIRTARTEAILRNQVVTIHSIDADWSNGWRIIADKDGKGPDEDDPVLVERAASGKARVVGNQKVESHISFNGMGVLMGAGNGRLFVCLKDQPVSRYQVVLALTGRVRIENQEKPEELCG
ncbi:general secretion pathway protein GspH [Pseudomonas syringae]|uniref:Type II secretion system protein H n=1 Tax=Pseudomonas syringae TaxID=317 RepID=A0A1C7YYT3_PSESX|nr:GspH/FimT family pseudopilin [Pseudomonas syringae]OCR21927.1 general secretion pathway protein GspH [Pseudomonas syringae]